ncbi:MAG: type II toxin-antitoxin system RelE/ParE family toxin [Bacteroides sp.]|nr:type II toxin-antitoxin system RelE/ParE family toxin [Ruminococcus flavefaciens]MCM1555309.1 type II toxin-antitoxin system RelE/ParE family toxin [Bacteroides sp.]
MNIDILTTEDFDRDFRRLAKRHRSLPQDLKKFRNELLDQKISGIELSPSVFKYRMGISSKGGGKSGGARIISYEILVEKTEKNVYLLTIYDKSDRENIPAHEIADLRKRAGLK